MYPCHILWKGIIPVCAAEICMNSVISLCGLILDLLSGCQAGTGSHHPGVSSAMALSWIDRCESLEHQEVACCRVVWRRSWPGRINLWCPSSLPPPGDERTRPFCVRLHSLSKFLQRRRGEKKTTRPESSAFSSAETRIHQSHLQRQVMLWIPYLVNG